MLSEKPPTIQPDTTDRKKNIYSSAVAAFLANKNAKFSTTTTNFKEKISLIDRWRQCRYTKKNKTGLIGPARCRASSTASLSNGPSIIRRLGRLVSDYDRQTYSISLSIVNS